MNLLTDSPQIEVAEATTVQPEGDPAQPGACREHLEPVEVAGRRPEPLTGPTEGASALEGCRQTPALPGESSGCQDGLIQDLAREQHHRGSHGPSVLPHKPSSRSAGLQSPAASGTAPGSNPPRPGSAPSPEDHQPLARLSDVGDSYRPACICGWVGVGVYRLRSEALVMARALHDDDVWDGRHGAVGRDWAGLGGASRGAAWQAGHGTSGLGPEGFGWVRYGVAGGARQGTERNVPARLGWAGSARECPGWAWQAVAGRGAVGQGRLGWVRRGPSRSGLAGGARRGRVRTGWARGGHGVAGAVRQGAVRLVPPWLVPARFGRSGS